MNANYYYIHFLSYILKLKTVSCTVLSTQRITISINIRNTNTGQIYSHLESQQTNTITLHMYYNWESTVSVNMSHNLRLERTPTMANPNCRPNCSQVSIGVLNQNSNLAFEAYFSRGCPTLRGSPLMERFYLVATYRTTTHGFIGPSKACVFGCSTTSWFFCFSFYGSI